MPDDAGLRPSSWEEASGAGCPRCAHLGFGHGAHICIGANVARLEGAVVLEELLARHPECAVDESRIERRSSDLIRGAVSLPLALGRRSA